MLGVSVNCALLGISGQLQDVFPMYTAVGIFLIVALLEVSLYCKVFTLYI